jgi:ABC-type phosphate transport system substrate-binding protein
MHLTSGVFEKMANVFARLASSISLVAVTTLAMSAAQPAQKAAAQIAGAGATAIQAAVENGFLNGVPYEFVGSGAGRNAFNAGSVDFASSDNTQIDGAVNVNAINIPVVAIGNEAAPEDLCGALTGANRPEGLTIIGRVAGSGTRNIVESSCGGAVVADQEFTSNDAVAEAVASTPNSIGYVDGPAAAAAGLASIGSVGEGPNFIIFRTIYERGTGKAAAAKALCQFVVSGGRDIATGLGYSAGSSDASACDEIVQDTIDEIVPLAGSGATAIQAAVDANFLLTPPNTYEAVGSGAGRTAFSAGSVDFASSDNTQVAGAVNVNAINIPVVAIGNEASVEDLCGALTGANKPEGLTVIGRVSGSGTRNIVESSCGGAVVADQEFTSNDAVAEAVANTPNSIGYVDGPAAAAAGLASIGSVGEGPNFIIFRPAYDAPGKAAAARALCLNVVGAGRDTALGLGYSAGSADASACDAIAQ